MKSQHDTLLTRRLMDTVGTTDMEHPPFYKD